ncbi:MAG TPA: amino acid permease [Candidatus Dormibacteraeota bacterium]
MNPDGEVPSSPLAPEPGVTVDASAYPESVTYRLKNALLGRPLVSEQLASQRLSKRVAFGVLAPDMISSSGYGTEEILVIMYPIIGIGAFSLVVPVTLAILAVLFFVTLSYLQVIGVYTRIGGSYVVARDNFGPYIAQIAAVALLIDYIVTVAVQTSAGTAALTSILPALVPYTVWITVAVTLVMFYGNLRGIREAGKIFAFPTYFFVISLSLVVVTGLIKAALGMLHAQPLPSAATLGWASVGQPGNGPLLGLGVFFLLKSFANGGVSLTGLEAISDSVGSFRRPVARNARMTLVIMCCALGFLVLGTSILAHVTHAVPYASGTPTVVSQEVHAVVGTTGLGAVLFIIVQSATVLILLTGGNTSFNGFPYLASFVAGDSFLPRQLTKRGHRLAFSNGIFVLTLFAIVLIIAFQARVDALVGLYAIGVFTGFTLAGSGMVKHNLRLRQGRWKLRVVVNGFSAVLSLTVVGVLLVTKFVEGAWLVALIGPPMYFGLLYLHRQYSHEEDQLEAGAAAATEAPVLRRHVVVVLINELDNAAARAIQYARSLRPEELRIVHFDIDAAKTEHLRSEWSRLGLARLPLDIVEAPDRRIDRAAVEYSATVIADGETECTVLLPRRFFHGRWQWLLHDRTADRIANAVEAVPHVSATIVPYSVASRPAPHVQRSQMPLPIRDRQRRPPVPLEVDQALARRAAGTQPIKDVMWRRRAVVAGRVRSVRVQTARGAANLECVLTDGTGDLLLVFQGRPQIPGIAPGARLVAEGMVGAWQGKLAMLNPDYELVSGPEE